MKKLILLLLAMLVPSLSYSYGGQQPTAERQYSILEQTEKAMIAIRANGPSGSIVCSAVAVGTNVVQTAAHCLPTKERPYSMWWDNAGVASWCLFDKVIANDGRDNVLIRTCRKWDYHVKRAENIVPYMPVFQYGWPDGQLLAYRVGVLSGRWFNPFPYPGLPYAEALMFSLNGTFGDSGGGIFNEKGELICTTSFVWIPHHSNFQMMGCYPHRFPREVVDAYEKEA